MLTWDESTNSGHPAGSSVFACYQIIRRNGAVISYEPSQIARAMMKAFLAVHATSEVAQRTCSGWYHDVWDASVPLKGSAPEIARATACNRPHSPASHQRQAKQHGFFGSSKPDMRNAP